MSTLRVNSVTNRLGTGGPAFNLTNAIGVLPPSALGATGSAPVYGCRAWVAFEGDNAFSPNPSTSAIRASGNISSITRNATGDYTINFATAMPDINYCVVSGVANPTYTEFHNIFDTPNGNYTVPTTSSFRATFYGQGAFRNVRAVMLAIYR